MVQMLALYGLFAHRMISGRVRACRPMLARMSDLARAGDSTLHILKLVNDCAYGLYSGRFALSMEKSAALRTLYDPQLHGGVFLQVGADPLVSVLTAEMHVHGQRGNEIEMRAALAQACAHVETIGAMLQRSWADIFGAAALFFCGHGDEAEALVADGIARADAQGAAFWQLSGRLWQGSFAAFGDRDPAAGRALLEATLPQAEAAGAHLVLPLFQSALARSHLAEGAPRAALAASRRAVSRLIRSGEGTWAPLVLRVHEEALRRTGHPDRRRRARQLADAYQARSGATIWDSVCRRVLT